MAIKTESKIIDDLSVKVVQLPPRRSYKLLARIGRVIGPAFEKLASVTMDSEISELAPALGAFFAELDDSVVDDLMERILQNVSVTYDNAHMPLTLQNFDLIFSGRELLGLKVMAFALQVQYAEHLSGAVNDQIKAAMAAKLNSLSKSQSQTTTLPMSGQSGDSGLEETQP